MDATIPRLRSLLASIHYPRLIHGHTTAPPDHDIWLTAINVNAGYWETGINTVQPCAVTRKGVTPSPFDLPE